jgi:hypothetical protein
MKNYLWATAALALCTCGQSAAQRTLTDIAQSAKFGGYVIGQYTASDNSSADLGFNVRMLRLYVNGTMFNDFRYRVQMEASGAPGVDKGTRLLDAYGEWIKYKGFQVKFGQQKRVFTFENPYNPFDVGFGSYSQAITYLSGFNDRVGEHACGGRDLGLVVQGDLFQVAKHPFLHYQLGVYNGQGINHREDKNAKDNANRNKDVIGGLWLNPVKGLSVGAFGWTGKYYNSSSATTYSRNRMAYGIKYEGDWTFRGEYIASEGGANNLGNKADAWYAAVGAPIGEKVRLYGRWDVYRQNKTHDSQSTIWGLTGEYWFAKNLKLQANYSYTAREQNAVGSGEHYYNTIDVQLYFRF